MEFSAPAGLACDDIVGDTGEIDECRERVALAVCKLEFACLNKDRRAREARIVAISGPAGPYFSCRRQHLLVSSTTSWPPYWTSQSHTVSESLSR